MKTKKITKKSVAFILIVFTIMSVGLAACGETEQEPTASGSVQTVQDDKAAAPSSTKGVTIDKDSVTEEALFIPYRSGDTDMEVIAIRASDGTVRTAFNTCQVCFDSGYGYYEQEGDVLVCQNCGNRFGVDQVEVTKGGCNPVPIFEDQKTETDDTITISDDVLAQYKTLFSNWKN